MQPKKCAVLLNLTPGDSVSMQKGVMPAAVYAKFYGPVNIEFVPKSDHLKTI